MEAFALCEGPDGYTWSHGRHNKEQEAARMDLLEGFWASQRAPTRYPKISQVLVMMVVQKRPIGW